MFRDNVWRDAPAQRDFAQSESDDTQLRSALAWLSTCTVEHMLIAYYNEHEYLISIEQIAKGNRTSASFETDEIFRRCLIISARSFIAIHNHPSTMSAPSYQDIASTKRLISQGAVFNINMLDSLIVDSRGNCTSLRGSKVIDPWYPNKPWAHHGPAIANALLSLELNIAEQSDAIRGMVHGPAFKVLLALYVKISGRLIQDISHTCGLSRSTVKRATTGLLSTGLAELVYPDARPRDRRYRLTSFGYRTIESILTGERTSQLRRDSA